MNSLRFPAAALATALLAACASSPAPQTPPPAPPTVLLLSIDGLRADMLDRGNSPNLLRLAREGVRAAGMRPSYPSLTFPNHYTLVTGLRPDHHGLIHNAMSVENLGDFRLSDRHAVTNAAWWEGGEPIWVTVEKAGYKSATWSWPGSEAPIQGHHASQWRPYQEGAPMSERVQLVRSWLNGAPDGVQPRLVATYMEHVDQAGHAHGPDSPEYAAALREVDTAIGQLIDGLASDGLLDRTNIVVVSDHGMATVKQGQAVATEDMVAPEIAQVVSYGQSVGFAPLPGKQAEAEKALLGEHAHYQCWNKANLPTRWHYGSNPRVPAIVCQMQEGWDAISRANLAKRPPGDRGSHGYDPALPSMQAVFVARGPSFVQGKQLPVFDNVDVYPLLTQLLGVTPRPNDGNPQTLQPALRANAK
ncbi:alkaline phosphatase family protein [Stenotrophomonas sp. SY1]|uniref:alkaline phosphatase family protein n=1 Tax=Stenotrophomonas sp. SY1 TaxID=477235 RepID=UPI001E2CA3F9|nr:alkaline phosphatase family protein [Stenotrophomonas sp. SY1]MCD9086335.1 alkaline phosphatase family protein [Stenotrophomonas sp. SY1]